MLVPLSWLTKYVPVSIPAEELAHLLTMSGTEVAGIKRIGAEWDRDKVMVGLVTSVDPHPNADRLTLPTVELAGGEMATVACGAPNVAAGQKIAFAREGARLFNTRSEKVEPLKASKIRGVVSAGMVCSALELGIGEDHEGILVLDDDARIGMPLVDYLGDTILDLDLTPNRPDCLSILGVAHEVAALTGEHVTEPDLSYPEGGEAIGDRVKIEIADPDLCYRYTASLISGITVEASPRWMLQVLEKAGLRPINNIVDITNYVMLEYNQPLHAFDFDTVKDRTVIVRQARPGEALACLDGQTRPLKPPMLTIADARDAVGLAGVIGGANSEIREGTTSVLLESANFDPINTRRTSQALRLSTEASYRFERGLRAELAPLALRRATGLILEIAGGEAARGIADVYPRPKEAPVVGVTRARIKQVLGADIGMDRVESILTGLGFEQASAGSHATDALNMMAPYWRSDIAIEDDLVEEVARIVGYDSLPTTMMSAPIPHHEPPKLLGLRELLKDSLVATGMREVISYSLTDLDTLDKVDGTAGVAPPIKISNPLSSQHEYLRPTLRGSILETLSRNWHGAQGEGIRLFEVGRVYLPRKDGGNAELPDEREMLIGVFSGPRTRVSWMVDHGDMDFFDAKGAVETLARRLGVEVEFRRTEDRLMHPGRAAEVLSGEAAVGVVGEVHPRVLDRFDISGRAVAMIEIDLEALLEVTPQSAALYGSTSRFPESERDLALVVDEDVPSQRIESIITGNRLVVRSAPFDVYSGTELPAGKKSIAYRIVFQSSKGTLTAEQVNRAEEEILRRLKRELGAERRG